MWGMAIAIGAFYAVNPDTREFFAGRFSLANVTTRSEFISLSFAYAADNPQPALTVGVLIVIGLFRLRASAAAPVRLLWRRSGPVVAAMIFPTGRLSL